MLTKTKLTQIYYQTKQALSKELLYRESLNNGKILTLPGRLATLNSYASNKIFLTYKVKIDRTRGRQTSNNSKKFIILSQLSYSTKIFNKYKEI